MNIRYIVELSEEERTRLHELTSGGQARVRRVKRGEILLAAEQGHGDAAVAAMVGVGGPLDGVSHQAPVRRRGRGGGIARRALLRLPAKPPGGRSIT